MHPRNLVQVHIIAHLSSPFNKFIFLGLPGAFGVDFSSLEDCGVWEGVETVRAGILKHGVTAFCPTIVTSDPEYYHKVLCASSKPP